MSFAGSYMLSTGQNYCKRVLQYVGSADTGIAELASHQEMWTMPCTSNECNAVRMMAVRTLFAGAAEHQYPTMPFGPCLSGPAGAVPVSKGCHRRLT